ncbi:MAG: hypothetical protein JWL64_1670 [Frankiales bacterium]|nr:hypothetical protein [Frankiales bacterium]
MGKEPSLPSPEVIPLNVLVPLALAWVIALVASGLALISLMAAQAFAERCRTGHAQRQRRRYGTYLAEPRNADA